MYTNNSTPLSTAKEAYLAPTVESIETAGYTQGNPSWNQSEGDINDGIASEIDVTTEDVTEATYGESTAGL